MYTKPIAERMARAAISMPSMSACGSRSSRYRSLKVPGSPSSALITRYTGPVWFFGMNDHLVPVGNPAPPRPRRFDFFTASVIASGCMPCALSQAV